LNLHRLAACMLRAAVAVGLCLVMLLGAFPSGATVAPAALHKRVLPVVGGTVPGAGQGVEATDLVYHNGPIQKAPHVYLVFWAWLGQDPDGEAPYLQRFFAGIGGSSWDNVHTQYSGSGQGFITNPANQLAGVWFDDSLSVPPVPDLYIDQEAAAAARHFNDYSSDATYMIFTAHLDNDLEFGRVYCGWHSSTNANGHEIAYSDIGYLTDAGGSCGENFVNPGDAGKLDGASIVGGHEFTEAVTDPHIDAWYDSGGAENADKCAWRQAGNGKVTDITLPTGTFAVQGGWSNAIHDCATSA
jgi:serine protease